jgi:hypothetical protein
MPTGRRSAAEQLPADWRFICPRQLTKSDLDGYPSTYTFIPRRLIVDSWNTDECNGINPTSSAFS